MERGKTPTQAQQAAKFMREGGVGLQEEKTRRVRYEHRKAAEA